MNHEHTAIWLLDTDDLDGHGALVVSEVKKRVLLIAVLIAAGRVEREPAVIKDIGDLVGRYAVLES